MPLIVRERVYGTEYPSKRGTSRAPKKPSASLAGFLIVAIMAGTFGVLRLNAEGIAVTPFLAKPGKAILALVAESSPASSSRSSNQQPATSYQLPVTSNQFWSSLTSRIGSGMYAAYCLVFCDERGTGLVVGEGQDTLHPVMKQVDGRSTADRQQPAARDEPVAADNQQSTENIEQRTVTDHPSTANTQPPSRPSGQKLVTANQSITYTVLGISESDLTSALASLESRLVPQIRAARESARSNRSRSDASPRPTFLTLADTFSSFNPYAIPFTNSEGTSLTQSSSFVYQGDKLGVASSTPTETLSVGGNAHLAGYLTLDAVTAPATSNQKLYNQGGDLYWAGNLIGGATTGNWTSNGTDVWRAGGNVGIASTTPSTELSVAGSGYLTGGLGVGMLNTTSGTLKVAGHCVTGDSRLTRRRKKKKGEKANPEEGEWEDDAYIYGPLRVDEVKGGEEIASLDEATGAIVWSRINALMDMGTQPIYKITTQSGKEIRTTGNHPYLMQQPITLGKKPRIGVFFDDSNIYHAQKKVGWRVSIKKLRHELAKHFEVAFVNYYNAIPAEGDPAREGVLSFMEKIRPQVTFHSKPLKYIGVIKDGKKEVKKKGDMDVDIALGVTESINDIDVALIISGDSDLLPLREYARTHGKKIAFAAFRQNMAWELTRGGSYIYLNDLHGSLALNDEITSQKKTNSEPELGVALTSALYTTRPSKSSGMWTKVSVLSEGKYIAVSGKGVARWDRIDRIEELPPEPVFDLEIAGTHNFIANGIVAHNTYLGGPLGVGTTSPWKTLSVAGDLSLTGGFFDSLASQGSSGSILTSTGSATKWMATSTLGLPTFSTLSATYPVQYNGSGLFSLAFGTTTSNTWGGTQTFTNLPSLPLTAGYTLRGSSGNTAEATSSLFVADNGNVGVGNSLPSYPLDVTGNIHSTSNVLIEKAASDTVQAGPSVYLNGGSGTSFTQLQQGVGRFDIWGFNGSTWIQNFSISNTSGKVGIGTVSPFSKLSFGNSGVANNPSNQIALYENSAGQLFYGLGLAGPVGAEGLGLWGGTGNSIPYNGTSGVQPHLFIQKVYGNVGIGTTNPQYKLEVNGSASSTNYYLPYTTSSALGVVYKGTDRFMHNFNYGNNGTVTTVGYNTFIGVNAGNFTMGSTATQTNHASYNTAVGQNALANNTTGYNNTANGVNALISNTTGSQNTANGLNALTSNTTGYQNTANGAYALYSNTTGNYNTANGLSALYSNTTGYYNTANGVSALRSNTTGYYNTANGLSALYYNQSATNTTALGFEAGRGTANYANQGGVYVGFQSGYSAGTGSDYNTLVGYQSGYGVTTGSNNILLGASAGYSGTNLTTGSNNIIIGYNIGATSSDMTRGLNIGNLIFGTGLDGSGTTLSTGNVGIGNTSPIVKLHVGSTAITDGTSLLRLEDANSTCDFTANSGSPSCGSDRTLKKNIETLSGSLEKVAKLNLVTYNWKTDQPGAAKQTGFIAQEVRDIFPDLVSENTWVDGSTKLFLNTGGLTPYLVGAVQELNLKMDELASTTAPFENDAGQRTFAGMFFARLTEWLSDTANGIQIIVADVFNAREVNTDRLCVNKADGTKVCVTGEELEQALSAMHADGTQEPSGGSAGAGGGNTGDSSESDTAQKGGIDDQAESEQNSGEEAEGAQNGDDADGGAASESVEQEKGGSAANVGADVGADAGMNADADVSAEAPAGPTE